MNTEKLLIQGGLFLTEMIGIVSKVHMIKSGGEFTINGWDDWFRTFCGLDENCSEDIQFCKKHETEQTTCKKCLKAYSAHIREYGKKVNPN